MPGISIIVPIFNGSQYLRYFLESLAKAAPPNADLILWMTDLMNLFLICVPDEFPGASVTKLRNERNHGYSVAVNRGFACARGEILDPA